MHRALGTLLALALALPAVGAEPSSIDQHVSADIPNNLYAVSAFAHGLRHGYEEGFHDADRDLHLSAFNLDDVTVPKVPKVVGYQPSSGSRESFRKGYEAGYRLGYADSVKGIAFRMTTPTVHLPTVAQDRDFDRGVQYGYSAPNAGRSGSPAFCAGVDVGRALVRGNEAGTQVASAK